MYNIYTSSTSNIQTISSNIYLYNPISPLFYNINTSLSSQTLYMLIEISLSKNNNINSLNNKLRIIISTTFYKR